MLLGIVAASMGAFALLFSAADGGVSVRATVERGVVGGCLTFVVAFWFLWLGWHVRQYVAMRRTPEASN